MSKDNLIKVDVHYIAAAKPFQVEAEQSETIGQLKSMALLAFKLTEGGGKTYKLFFDHQEQTNMSVTLGQLAGGKNHLKFDLEEIIVQG